jgi:hypothetical protein
MVKTNWSSQPIWSIRLCLPNQFGQTIWPDWGWNITHLVNKLSTISNVVTDFQSHHKTRVTT